MVSTARRLGGIEDRRLFACHRVDGPTSRTLYELVLETDVREGAPHHDFMVTAAGAVGVKVGIIDAVRAKIGRRRRRGVDGARRRDMIGGDEIAEKGQATGVLDSNRVRAQRVVQKCGPANVGRGIIPREGLTTRRIERAPRLIPTEQIVIGALEQALAHE